MRDDTGAAVQRVEGATPVPRVERPQVLDLDVELLVPRTVPLLVVGERELLCCLVGQSERDSALVGASGDGVNRDADLRDVASEDQAPPERRPCAHATVVCVDPERCQVHADDTE